MHVIPVIDVREGQVVRAAGGDRAGYRPIRTVLAPGSDPVAIARGLLTLTPFPTLYVADLDGIENARPDLELIERLAAALPATDLWVDNGTADPAAAGLLLACSPATLVAGSETMSDAAALKELYGTAGDRLVLSLDFRDDEFLGPLRLLEDAGLWPARVIVMTLARVGSDAGPDLQRIAEISARGAGRHVYAAGGIRHCADLVAARNAGAAGALVATALHAGMIKAGDLARIAGFD